MREMKKRHLFQFHLWICPFDPDQLWWWLHTQQHHSMMMSSSSSKRQQRQVMQAGHRFRILPWHQLCVLWRRSIRVEACRRFLFWEKIFHHVFLPPTPGVQHESVHSPARWGTIQMSSSLLSARCLLTCAWPEWARALKFVLQQTSGRQSVMRLTGCAPTRNWHHTTSRTTSMKGIETSKSCTTLIKSWVFCLPITRWLLTDWSFFVHRKLPNSTVDTVRSAIAQWMLYWPTLRECTQPCRQHTFAGPAIPDLCCANGLCNTVLVGTALFNPHMSVSCATMFSPQKWGSPSTWKFITRVRLRRRGISFVNIVGCRGFPVVLRSELTNGSARKIRLSPSWRLTHVRVGVAVFLSTVGVWTLICLWNVAIRKRSRTVLKLLPDRFQGIPSGPNEVAVGSGGSSRSSRTRKQRKRRRRRSKKSTRSHRIGWSLLDGRPSSRGLKVFLALV